MAALSGSASQSRQVQEPGSLLRATRALLRERRRARFDEPYLAQLRVEARRLRRAARPDGRRDVA